MSIQALNPAAFDASQLQASRSQEAARADLQPAPAAADTQAIGHAAPPVQEQNAPQEAQKSREPTQAELDDAIGRVQNFFQNKAKDLVFSLDDDSGRTIVKVIDSQTEEVLRQFPSKEMLALAHSLDETQKALGLLVQSKA